MTDQTQQTQTTDTTQTQATVDTSQQQTADWTASLSPELKELATKNGFKDVGSVLSAYGNLNRMIGTDKIELPNKDGAWSPEALKKLGVPEKPDGYKVARPEKLPEGVKYNEDFEKAMLPVAHRLGLTPFQVNQLLGAVTNLGLEQHKASAASGEAAKTQVVEALKAEFGTAYTQRVEVAKRAVEHFGGDGLKAYLNESGLGDHPEMVKAFAKIGMALGEDKMRAGDSQGFGMTPAEAKDEAERLTKTEAYRNKNHPEHKLTFEKATKLFEMAYPNQAQNAA